MTIPIGTRIRERDDASAEAVRIGTGVVVGHDESGLNVVHWDEYGPALRNYRTDEQVAEVRMPVCRYEPETWKRKVEGIDGAVLICRTHKAPAAPEAYDDLSTTARCRGPW